MTLWALTQLKNLLKALNSAQTPAQLSLGFTLGVTLGLVPFNLLYWSLFGSLLFLLNVNRVLGFLGIFISGSLAFIIDIPAHQIGLTLLQRAEFLEGVWTSLYNLPLVPFLQFNNTVVLGSMILSYILFFPVYKLSYRAVIAYRSTWREKLLASPIYKLLQASRLFTALIRIWEKV